MTSTSVPIVFFGTEAFSLTALTGLIEAGYTIAAVVTKPDSKRGRGNRLTPPQVKVLAAQNNIPVWQPEKLRDITPDILKLDRPAGVLSSYGKIVPKSVIDLFTPGIINIHPSLLPLYRGPAPIEAAIRNGDSKTGVSIMQLSPGMDEGPVYVAQEYQLTQKETRPELYHALADLGANLLLESLPRILEGSLRASPQDNEKATYTRLLDKQDAWLHPEMLSAAEAERHVRAHLGFPKTKTTHAGHQLIITKAHTGTEAETPLDVTCKDGKILIIDEIIAPSGRTMSAAEFARGYLRT